MNPRPQIAALAACRRRAIAVVAGGFLLAGLLDAQPARAQASAGDLPMRNLQIEVRQLQGGTQSGTNLSGAGTILLSPGHSGGQFGLSGGAREGQMTRSSTQMALVLNGRETRIALGNTVPVRVLQSFVRDGQVHVLPGTVLVDANTGFAARPVWRGGETVDIEIGTALASARGAPGAAASATVAAPLGEWFTIAQSDDAFVSQSSGSFGQGRQSAQGRLEIQLRVSVR